MPDPHLDGLSVFVVEDEALVLLNLEDMLAELGCNVVGPAMRLDRALAMTQNGIAADAAILDVNLGGEKVFPLAEKLVASGVPVVFATGYGKAGLPEIYHALPILQKPYTVDEVAAGLRTAMRSVGTAAAAS